MKFFGTSLFSLLLFALFLGGAVCADAAPRAVWANGLRHVDLSDAATALGGSAVSGKTQVILVHEKRRFILYPDKRFIHLDGLRINLCHPLLMRNGRAYLGQIDYNTVLIPLLSSGKQYRHPIRKIVLDPGHGGRDQGASGSRMLEKTITLNLSNRVAKILRAYGYKVELTRTRDTMLSLGARSAYSNRAKADLFVSIHVNSTQDRSVRGIETFCMTPEGATSSNSGGPPDSKRYAGNANNACNFLLAYHLQRSLLGRTSATDRGVKFARFAVLRDVTMPAALVEVGFLSNSEDAANLGSSAYLDKLARGIAAGILNYHRSLAK